MEVIIIKRKDDIIWFFGFFGFVFFNGNVVKKKKIKNFIIYDIWSNIDFLFFFYELV